MFSVDFSVSLQFSYADFPSLFPSSACIGVDFLEIAWISEFCREDGAAQGSNELRVLGNYFVLILNCALQFTLSSVERYLSVSFGKGSEH